MPVELTCSCGKRLQVSEDFSGRQGQCPACRGLLQIPERTATVAWVVPSSDKAKQAVFAARGLSGPKRPNASQDAVTPTAGTAAELHDGERGSSGAHNNVKLTSVGCVLTLLSVAVIFCVALPIVRWRDPATGQPLPRILAIISPIVIGAIFHGIVSLLLRFFGLQIEKKQETDMEK
jgi:hypothetical protein